MEEEFRKCSIYFKDGDLIYWVIWVKQLLNYFYNLHKIKVLTIIDRREKVGRKNIMSNVAQGTSQKRYCNQLIEEQS